MDPTPGEGQPKEAVVGPQEAFRLSDDVSTISDVSLKLQNLYPNANRFRNIKTIPRLEQFLFEVLSHSQEFIDLMKNCGYVKPHIIVNQFGLSTTSIAASISLLGTSKIFTRDYEIFILNLIMFARYITLEGEMVKTKDKSWEECRVSSRYSYHFRTYTQEQWDDITDFLNDPDKTREAQLVLLSTYGTLRRWMIKTQIPDTVSLPHVIEINTPLKEASKEEAEGKPPAKRIIKPPPKKKADDKSPATGIIDNSPPRKGLQKLSPTSASLNPVSITPSSSIHTTNSPHPFFNKIGAARRLLGDIQDPELLASIGKGPPNMATAQECQPKERAVPGYLPYWKKGNIVKDPDDDNQDERYLGKASFNLSRTFFKDRGSSIYQGNKKSTSLKHL